jgi:hypothetical protein
MAFHGADLYAGRSRGLLADGFAGVTTPALRALRRNLLRGLGQVAARLDAGTSHEVGAKGEAPPAQSGQLTLLLLRKVDAELQSRLASTFRRGGNNLSHKTVALQWVPALS